jgi:flagellar hook assembly protein FlgD
VNLQIYSVTGQLVRTLVNEKQKAGKYSALWNSRDEKGKRVASGIYFYRLETSLGDRITKTKKMTLAR